jgi:hypothetical protein
MESIAFLIMLDFNTCCHTCLRWPKGHPRSTGLRTGHKGFELTVEAFLSGFICSKGRVLLDKGLERDHDLCLRFKTERARPIVER